MKKEKPKILFLTHQFPRPTSGFGQRTRTFLRALSRDWDIRLVTRCPIDIKPTEISELESLGCNVVPIPASSFQWRGYLLRLMNSQSRYLRALPLLFSRTPIFLNNNLLLKSEQLEAYLQSLKWADFDIIHVERISLAHSYIDNFNEIRKQRVRAVIDLDELESEVIARSMAYPSSSRSTYFGRFLRRLDLQRLRKYESEIIPRFDACTVSSDIEMRHLSRLGFAKNKQVIPNSIDTRYYAPDTLNETRNKDILFVGQMSYSPNVDAVTYFVQKIFPAVLKKVPSARFFIVGQKPSENVMKLHDATRVIVTGEVLDTRVYHEQCAVFVTPIRFGGGTRIKILEAMAMKKAVVSTSVGAEGIPVTHGRDIIIADNEDEFAAQCVRLIEDHPLNRIIGDQAREFVSKFYDSRIIEDRICSYYSWIMDAG
jgi:glycosyltransferase involved in cell wall biosynthesis